MEYEAQNGQPLDENMREYFLSLIKKENSLINYQVK